MNAIYNFSKWLYTRPPILLHGAWLYFCRLMAKTGWPMPSRFLWVDRRVSTFILWWMNDEELTKVWEGIDAKDDRIETRTKE